MKLRTIAFATLLGLAACAATAPAYATGTINLNLDASHYCATTQSGNDFRGISQGLCPITPPTACPAGRVLNSQISYDYGRDQRRQADLTKADAILGYFSMTDALHIMPWAQGTHPTIYGFPSNGYIAMQLTVPTTLPVSQTGLLTHAETLPGPALTAAISTQCGDFSPANSQCGPITAGTGQLMAKWKIATAAGNGCPLTSGGVYYINLKIASPSLCTAPYCAATIQSNHTP